jgi:RecT family
MLDKAHASEVTSSRTYSGTNSGPSSSPTRSRPRALLPRSLKEALQLADLIHRSKLAPKGFDTPESCLVGILYGMEVGLSPIAALQRMAIIDGRPTIWGDAALALVQASGLLISIREEIQEDATQPNINRLTAICIVNRHGRAEPVTKTFSVEDAKRAGLWQKPGPWTDYPKRMLAMRARAFALRDAFPDVLAGLYLREELEPVTTSQQSTMEGKEQNDALPSDHPNPEPHIAQSRRDSEDHIPAPNKRRAPPPPLPPSADTDPNTNTDADKILSSTEDATSLITLFDDALCCAFDPETLEEIREEFQPKIDRLGSDFIEYAGRVFLRHEQRVQQINNHIADDDHENGNAHSQRAAVFNPRPRRRPQRTRRSARSPSVSLLALNARQRLSAIHHKQDKTEEDIDCSSYNDIADVNIMTSSATAMLTSQHLQSQSLPSIVLETQHSKAEANDQSEPCQMIRQTLSVTPAQEPDTVQSSDT